LISLANHDFMLKYVDFKTLLISQLNIERPVTNTINKSFVG